MKGQNKNTFKFIMMLMFFAITFANVNAQITIFDPVNVNEGLNDGTIQATVEPEFTSGSIDKLFDGNAYTEGAINNSDTIIITLIFDDAVNISKNKIFFWNNGNYSLETADNIDDLNNQTGSYNLLIENKNFTAFTWDSLEFGPISIGAIRVSAKNSEENSIYFGEWEISKYLNLTKLIILPYPPKLIPGTTLNASYLVEDENGNVFEYDLGEPVEWSSSNPSIATVNAGGQINGISLGSCEITARTETNSISGTATCQVVNDFVSEKVETHHVKVALVLQDPVINSQGQRLHSKFGWGDPNYYVNQIIEEFANASDGTVDFEVTLTIDDQNIWTMIDSVFLTPQQLVQYYQEPNWQTLKDALANGTLKFGYREMLDYYDLCEKRNNEEIDEVWVYAHPYASMYESILAGEGAFWWNSPPLQNTSCVKLLSIMGWNYERGVSEAMHSVGHRVESALWHAYGRWDIHNENPNNWELFTRIDIETPGQAHVGNIHYPHNGVQDYDYSNNGYADSYADNWTRYPYLLDTKRNFNCLEWGCGHLGYMRFWFSHLPRYKGKTNGILNDWWHYALDYYEAVELADITPVVSVESTPTEPTPESYKLDQNFPNPFNPVTTINYTVAKSGKVKLNVFDILGREVQELVNEEKPAGNYQVTFSANKLASGVYFYQLQSNGFSITKKMILLK